MYHCGDLRRLNVVWRQRTFYLLRDADACMAAWEVDGLQDTRDKVPLVVEEVSRGGCERLRCLRNPDIGSERQRVCLAQTRRQRLFPIRKVFLDERRDMRRRWNDVVWLQEAEQPLQALVANNGDRPHV